MLIGAQANTQQYGRRPYGVGFLVIGQDVSFPLSPRPRVSAPHFLCYKTERLILYYGPLPVVRCGIALSRS